MKKVMGGVTAPIGTIGDNGCPVCSTARDCLPAYKCMANENGCETCHRD